MTRRLLLPLLGLLTLAGVASAAPTDDQIKATYRELIGKVNQERIAGSMQALTPARSRLAGSAGEARALDYAQRRFQEMGFRNIRRQEFNVTVPDPDAVGTLDVGTPIKVYPMWPNLVRTSTCDVSGPLVYGGTGSLEALTGKKIDGAIVVLEYNTGARWRNAAKLGAKAIVFIEPRDTSRAESESKFTATPINVPRFYLPLDQSAPVLAAAFRGQTARLRCVQNWVQRKSANLFAELPATQAGTGAEPIVLSAYADAMSVVPGLAPGADSATGLAGLLEVAEILRERPLRRRSVRFMVTGAHFLALQGVREYVDGLMRNPEPPPLLAVTFDLSSGSRTLGAYAQGWFYDFRWEARMRMQNMTRIYRNHANRLKDVYGLPEARMVLTDPTNDSDNRPWKNNIPGRIALDCEPMVLSSMNATTLATVEDSREATDTPFDTLDRVNLANVARQVQTLICLVHHTVNDTSNQSEPSDHKIPLEPMKPEGMTLVGGFGVVNGRVVAYDPQQSFLPDVSVPNSLAVLLHREKSLMGVRGTMVQRTEGDRSNYRFTGIAPVTAYWRTWVRPVQTAAFRVNESSGDVDYAPDTGMGAGQGQYQPAFRLKTSVKSAPIVVFPCVGVGFFDLIDPQDLRVLVQANPLDAETDASPRNYGFFRPLTTGDDNPDVDDTAVLFMPRGNGFKLLMGSGLGETRLILTHSTKGNEAGDGYLMPGAQPDTAEPRRNIALDGRFPDTMLNAARDILAINQARVDRFKTYRILSAGVEEMQKTAQTELELAEAAQKELRWADADRHARAAWGYALRAHPVIQKTANDVVNGVVFYLFLLIPFSYFLERLVFASRTLTRQLAYASAIFIGTFLILRFIHPAFEIVGNPSMIFIGFVMGALSLIVIMFICGKFEQSLKALKQLQSGVKEVDVQRVSVALAAFSLGVGNMRRRKARTILTTLTLVVMTFIVLSFTSIVSELKLNELPSENEARYSGILLRNPGLEPMEDATYRQVLNEFGDRGAVVRRTYDFGAELRDTGVMTVTRAERFAEIRAVLGLDPAEEQVLRPQEALLPGGRWFRPEDKRAILLPSPVAETLKVSPEEVGKAKVEYAGVEYTVIGILDAAVLRSLTDLDGDSVLPPDFSLSRRLQEDTRTSNRAFRSFIRLDPSQVVILPSQTALGLGGRLRTLGVAFREPKQTRTALDSVMPRLRLNLYASVPDESGKLEVRQFSVFQASRGTGLILILVQMAIAAVFVLNTMIASVYERTKEISIFSSIGLAPNHISMLFFAESLVYGVLGAVTGYVMAQSVAKVVTVTGAFPGLYLNFSSTSAVLSAGLVMGIVLLSTIYPARQASRIAAPAMNEKAFDVEPDGDDLRIPLPFQIGAEEAAPLTAFLAEWLQAYEEYTIGDFVTSGTRFTALETDRGRAYVVRTLAWLAPYDLGISQTVTLQARPSEVDGVFMMDLEVHREAGDPENWVVVNRRYMGNLRKQFLTWRTLDADARKKYIALAEAAPLDGEKVPVGV